VRRLFAPALAVALIGIACQDAAGPSPHPTQLSAAVAAPAGSGITLDQFSSTLNDATVWPAGGMHIGKGFLPTNPRLGDAIVATFFWRGTTNTITTVGDHLCDVNSTPVGNVYHFVDYVTAGGYSMAIYVATNVQGIPQGSPPSDSLLCVHALFSDSISEGGVMLSAYQGVGSVATEAMGAHRAAVGSGSSVTVADPGAIPVGAGALAYAVTMSDGVAGTDAPVGFTNITDVSDSAIKADGEYAVPTAVGTVDPQWNWYFSAPHAWLAGVLALNPPPHLVFTVQPKTTLPLMTIPAIRVTVTNALGSADSSFIGSVTIAIGHNGGTLMPGTLSGTKTVAVVNGVATFGDLSIDQLGNGYTLVVTANGTTGTESAPFDIGVN
jgi:hypothetical protein